jgi:hypothetical protein
MPKDPKKPFPKEVEIAKEPESPLKPQPSLDLQELLSPSSPKNKPSSSPEPSDPSPVILDPSELKRLHSLAASVRQNQEAIKILKLELSDKDRVIKEIMERLY